MSTRRWLTIGVVVLLVLWAVLFLRLGGDREPQEETAADAPAQSTSRAAEQAPRAASVAPSAAPPPTRAADAAPQAQAAPGEHPPPQPTTIGYIEGFKRAYDGQPRDAQAAAAEARLRSLLRPEIVPRDMLSSVSCHKTVCKMRVRWTKQRAMAYMSLLMTTADQFNSELATEVPAEPDGAGNLDVDVYVLREGIREVEPSPRRRVAQ